MLHTYGFICGWCGAGGARFDDGAGGDNEVQRTMLEIVNQLDGFDARGNVKVGVSAEHSITALGVVTFLVGSMYAKSAAFW